MTGFNVRIILWVDKKGILQLEIIESVKHEERLEDD